MKSYIDKVKDLLESELKMRGTKYSGLLDTYALLVLIVGVECTNQHIHDAWSVWQNQTQPDHRSMIPFDQLTKEVQDLDTKYRLVVIKAARALESNSDMADGRTTPHYKAMMDRLGDMWAKFDEECLTIGLKLATKNRIETENKIVKWRRRVDRS